MERSAKLPVADKSTKKIAGKNRIGWREWAAFPDLGIKKMKVKIDTGARTSAIHAFNIHEFDVDGQLFVRFSVYPFQKQENSVVDCTAKMLEKRMITSSNGFKSERYIIETRLVIGDDSWLIELSLASRDQLGFRALLGREAIRGRCVVDAGVSYKAGVPILAPQKEI